MLDSAGLKPARITFVKHDKPIFTIDWTDDGEARVIYSQGFLDRLPTTTKDQTP